MRRLEMRSGAFFIRGLASTKLNFKNPTFQTLIFSPNAKFQMDYIE